MNKVDALDALQKDLECANLPLKNEANLVFGEGSHDCSVMFVGEAPGQKEDELRRPFVGRAGQLLNKLIEKIGWKREDVYITNIVKRRPPENRDPFPEEIEAYAPYLAKQIEIINPKIIAPLGRFSMNYFLPFAKITRDQGKVFGAENRLIYPLFHPAAALRNPETMKALETSFQNLPNIVEKTPSPLSDSPLIAPKKKEQKKDSSSQKPLF